MDHNLHPPRPCDAVPEAPAITAEVARQALLSHAAATGAMLRDRAGGGLDYPRLITLLQDPDVVRFPVHVVFDAQPLQGEELAYPLPVENDPTNGFTMYVHSQLATYLDDATAAILYAVVVVNYGDAATGEVAEAFGAAALGVDREAYYGTICRIADGIPR
ncbi:MAG: hypothetical protein PVF51_01340 [Nitrospirota bacterium]|jgi:hypothetical protein